MADGVDRVFEIQAAMCRRFGSEFYARLLERAVEDLGAGGPTAAVVSGWDGRRALLGILPLRLLAAVHRRVLAGKAPELARHYPSAGGSPRHPEAGEAFIAELARAGDDLGDQLDRFPQTNEVARAGALLLGFLAVAKRTNQALRLFEIGASAGLNLNWHRYDYDLGGWRWGPGSSPVAIRPEWRGAPPDGPAWNAVRVASAEGCDLAPVDARREEEAERLCSYVWADQPGRLSNLRDALAVAREHPPRVTAASAGDWLPKRLAAAPEPGAVRVVYHSAAWFYIPETEQRQLRESVEAAGERADASAPLAWLRLEHEGENHALRLRCWPGGEDETLAEVHPQGLWVAPAGSDP